MFSNCPKILGNYRQTGPQFFFSSISKIINMGITYLFNLNVRPIEQKLENFEIYSPWERVELAFNLQKKTLTFGF
jgi:hypothetical protein